MAYLLEPSCLNGSLTYSLSKRLSDLYVSYAIGVFIPSEQHMFLYNTSLSTVPARSVIINSNKISQISLSGTDRQFTNV